MKKLVLAAAALLACEAVAAAPTLAAQSRGAAPSGVAAKGVVYSQNGTDSGIGIVSQNFESSFDSYDAMAADDFTVTKAKIVEVDVNGVYFNGSGPAQSVNITFYKNKKGLPGAVLKTYADATILSDNGGDLKVAVPKTVVKGTVWVSVQANMDFAEGGEWGWENQTTVVGSPAAWENPGDGFGTGCTTWKAEATCIPDGQGDHMFTLLGKGH